MSLSFTFCTFCFGMLFNAAVRCKDLDIEEYVTDGTVEHEAVPTIDLSEVLKSLWSAFLDASKTVEISAATVHLALHPAFFHVRRTDLPSLHEKDDGSCIWLCVLEGSRGWG